MNLQKLSDAAASGDDSAVDALIEALDQPAAPAAPEFKTLTEAQSWIERKARAHGGKRQFYATPEYKAAYPAIKALYDVDRAGAVSDAAALLAEAGLSVGDRVYTYSRALMGLGGRRVTGTIQMRSGVPVVKADSEQTVSRGGRLSSSSTLPWTLEWRKDGTETNPAYERLIEAPAAARRKAQQDREAADRAARDAENAARAAKVAAFQAQHGTLTRADVELGDVLESFDEDAGAYREMIVTQFDQYGGVYATPYAERESEGGGSITVNEYRKTGVRDPEGAVLVLNDRYDRVKIIGGKRVPVVYSEEAGAYVPA